MTTREELFQKFGPLLIEALVEELVEEVNRLRRKLKMREVTNQEAWDAIENNVSHLEPYDWMKRRSS